MFQYLLRFFSSALEPQYERFVSPEKNTSLDGLRDRGVVSSQLFKVDEFKKFLRSLLLIRTKANCD